MAHLRVPIARHPKRTIGIRSCRVCLRSALDRRDAHPQAVLQTGPQMRSASGIMSTLGPIRKLPTALSASADLSLFSKEERGPSEDLRHWVEGAPRFDVR